MAEMPNLNVRFHPQTLAQLRELAVRTERGVGWHVRLAVARYLNRQSRAVEIGSARESDRAEGVGCG